MDFVEVLQLYQLLLSLPNNYYSFFPRLLYYIITFSYRLLFIREPNTNLHEFIYISNNANAGYDFASIFPSHQISLNK